MIIIIVIIYNSLTFHPYNPNKPNKRAPVAASIIAETWWTVPCLRWYCEHSRSEVSSLYDTLRLRVLRWFLRVVPRCLRVLPGCPRVLPRCLRVLPRCFKVLPQCLRRVLPRSFKVLVFLTFPLASITLITVISRTNLVTLTTPRYWRCLSCDCRPPSCWTRRS